MSRFVQLHLLTSYPPSNLNRDDLGRPKTAIMGGKNRLRISSQSLKRAWRTSEVFKEALEGNIGTRTKIKGRNIYDALRKAGVNEKNSMDWARKIAECFGKLQKKEEETKEEKNKSKKSKETESTKEKKEASKEKEAKEEKNKKDPFAIEQLAHFTPEEEKAIDDLIKTISKKKRAPSKEELSLLKKENSAADIALFGRMLASEPAYNIEASVQVAHAITVQSIAVEDDYFTAVDDLNKGDEDRGAGHLGETEFASGLFYLYICIDREKLIENLSENSQLVKKTLKALIECAATVAPTGKQNSFASRSRASYIRCEKGNQQPRSLSMAFLKAVDEKEDILAKAIENIEDTAKKMDGAYGKCAETVTTMDLHEGKGKLEDIIKCATED